MARQAQATTERLAFLDGAAHPPYRRTRQEQPPPNPPSGYPERGQMPTIQPGLDFLPREVTHACVLRANGTWLGRNALEPAEQWSASKVLLPILLRAEVDSAIARVNDVTFAELLDRMLTYAGGDTDSNRVAATFKNFHTEARWLELIRERTGHDGPLRFGRNYGGEVGFWTEPVLLDEFGQVLLRADDGVTTGGQNYLSAYDLLRVFCDYALAPTQRELTEALRKDPAVYVDAARENVSVLGKMGFGPGTEEAPHQITYLAFVQSDRDWVGMALRVSETADVTGDYLERLKTLDTRMAEAVALVLE